MYNKRIHFHKWIIFIRRISRGRFTYAKFAKLKELAKNSIGCHDENTDLLVSTYISIINNFNDKIDPINKQISTILERNPRQKDFTIVKFWKKSSFDYFNKDGSKSMLFFSKV